jgi:hypothetical protein
MDSEECEGVKQWNVNSLLCNTWGSCVFGTLESSVQNLSMKQRWQEPDT